MSTSVAVQVDDDSIDPYSGLPRAPLFATGKDDFRSSEQHKPLGAVYYDESGERSPLLSQSVAALTNR